VAPGEHDERIGVTQLAGCQRAVVGPAEQRDLSPQPLRAQPFGIQAREAERPLGHARTGALHGDPHGTEPAEILAPVRLAPHLKPVDDEPEPAPGPDDRRRQQREVRKRTGVHDIVAPAVAGEVPQDAGAEHEGRQDSPVAGAVVERHAGPDDADFDPGHTRVLAPVPLAKGDVGDLVTGRGQPFGQVSVPPLGAADGIGEQAVVDQADAHSGCRLSYSVRCKTAAAATFASRLRLC
jgi:hypothetical protein